MIDLKEISERESRDYLELWQTTVTQHFLRVKIRIPCAITRKIFKSFDGNRCHNYMAA